MGKGLRIDTDRLLGDLKHLATFGKAGNGVNRQSLTAVDLSSRKWLCERMREAGLEAGIDGIGTVVGRTPHARRILIGSHTDTVPNGGWLDGAMGVIYGIEIGRAVMAHAADYDVGVEIISFVDEEGRFTPLFGSHVFCGEFSEDIFDDLVSADGTAFQDARAQANLGGVPVQYLDPDVHVAFLEAHIEQGPVLEAKKTKIGAVTGIVGASQFKIQFRGQANHAGTTPMSMRRDAATAMFDFVQGFTEFCKEKAGEDTVWTYSEIRTEPTAGNVIPNLAEISVQFRDTSPEILAILDVGVQRMCEVVTATSGVEFCKEKTVQLTPTPMDKKIVSDIILAATKYGASVCRMSSGAGHDAMVVGRYIPTGMLFIPSIGGLSHDTEENSWEEDIRVGAEVLALTVSGLINNDSSA